MRELGYSLAAGLGTSAPKPAAWVTAFQLADGLRPGGIAGPATLAALESLRSTFTYVVQPGDSLWAIARRFGVSMEEIVRLNNLPDRPLWVGDRLILRGPAGVPGAARRHAVGDRTAVRHHGRGASRAQRHRRSFPGRRVRAAAACRSAPGRRLLIHRRRREGRRRRTGDGGSARGRGPASRSSSASAASRGTATTSSTVSVKRADTTRVPSSSRSRSTLPWRA